MENFVPYELAVKLKEKGFREKVNAYYGKHENIFDIHPALDMNDADYRASAPTISQVLKWLREEKKIFILIDIRVDLSWFYEIWGIEIRLHTLGCVPYQKYQSYELAALAGIEYVLNNLI